MDRLDPGGIVDMGDRRNVGTRHVELVDTEKLRLGLAHLAASRVLYPCHQQHVGRFRIKLEPVGDVLAQDRWRKWPKTLAVFHFEVQRLLHGGRTGVAEDRAIAQ